MKKRDFKSIYLILSLVLYAVLYRLFIVKYLLKFSGVITATFLLVLFFISYLFLGFQRNKMNSIRKETVTMIVICVLVYFIAIYGVGFITGFLKNSYSMNLLTMLGNIFSPIFIVIFEELFRYNLIRSNKDKKYLIVLVTIALIIFDLSLNLFIEDYVFDVIFVKLTTIALPIFIKQSVMTYLSLELGYIPTLFYRLMMEIYVFVVPVIPDIGDYFISMLGIIMPLLIFMFTSRMMREYYNGVERDFSKSMFSVADIPFACVIILLMILISGILRYQLIGVASGSMHPTIDKGDAVLVDQNISVEKLQKGDIIAYTRDDLIIIHRIIDIDVQDDVVIFNTKGDANNADDDLKLRIEDIKGKVIFRIPYIAWPSVYLSEMFD